MLQTRSRQSSDHSPVALIIPPFFTPTEPTLASGILKASVEQLGIRCRVLYANILFAQRLGFSLHQQFMTSDSEALLCERLFASFAHPQLGEEPSPPAGEGSPYPRLPGGGDPLTPSQFRRAQQHCEGFLEDVLTALTAWQPKILGFSTTFQQTNAAIAIARRARQIFPDTLFVIGGHNCDGEMGEELCRSIDTFDYVFQGEADFAFAQFCQTVLQEGRQPSHGLIVCPPQHTLDDIPSPDYSDFLAQSNVPADELGLYFESSRGCWWGQKHHCTFCGLNGSSMGFRIKPAAQVEQEVQTLKHTYPAVRRYSATDLIAPQVYHHQGFPRLATAEENVDIFYEVKANTTSDQLRAMRQAGVTMVQPGIESFSASVLKGMAKGCSPAMNIRLLRDCHQLGITPVWNILVEVPGDTIVDYTDQIRLLPLLEHLFPPAGVFPIVLQRFSPYHFDAERFQIQHLRPATGYRFAFPDTLDHHRLAYFFEADYPSAGRTHPDLIDTLHQLVASWRDRWASPTPARLELCEVSGTGWVAFDTRACATAPVRVLDTPEVRLIQACRTPHQQSALMRHHRLHDLQRLLDYGFLVEVGPHIISLVCEPRGAEEHGTSQEKSSSNVRAASKSSVSKPSVNHS